jgi:hypothetical protein
MSGRHRYHPARWLLGRPQRRPIILRESDTAVLDAPPTHAPPAGAAVSVSVVEASTGTLTSSGGRRYRARLIEGDRWGSSGYYPRRVLERDGPKAWPIGTLMYLDHPTAAEEAERPERSVKDLSAKVITTPVYESDGLYADIEVFPHAAPIIESLADTLGLSIRGEGTGAIGTVAGRTGVVIETLDVGYSVDFVTRAGAGGKLISLLEAARAIAVREARNVEAWLESRIHSVFTQLADDMYGDGRLTREERIALSGAVGDALTAFTARLQADAPQLSGRDIYDQPPAAVDGSAAVSEAGRRRIGEATSDDVRAALTDAVRAAYATDDLTRWVWVRDYDADQHLVWFDVSDREDCDTYQQGYQLADGDPLPTATLTGEQVEVVARTVYTPVPMDPEDEAEMADDTAAVGESDRPTPLAAVPATEPAADPVALTEMQQQTDGAPPTATTPIEEAPMSGTNTGPVPGAAGTDEGTSTVPTAVAEAQRAQAAAEQQLAEANRRTAEAEQRLARLSAVEAARPIASTMLAETQLPAAAQARVLTQVTAQVPMTEALALDEAAFRTAITTAAQAEATYIASLRESAGEGRVAGLGDTTTAAADTAKFETDVAEGFVRLGMSESAAKIAAGGRR